MLGSEAVRQFPHWESPDRSVLLVNADCLSVLPTLEAGSVDAVVTDPPWKARKDRITRRAGGVASVVNPSQCIGYGAIGQFSVDALQEAWRVVAHDMLVICGYKELGQVIAVMEPIRGVFIWHKPNGGISVAYPSPLDVAYIVWGAKVSKLTGYQHWKSGVMSHSVPTAGCISNGERILTEPNGPALHPAQGPLSLYEQLVGPMRGTVLDCYMGTGTCGVAAIRTGRRFIGIEIDPAYFNIARDRCLKELNRFPLFDNPSPPPIQRSLLTG